MEDKLFHALAGKNSKQISSALFSAPSLTHLTELLRSLQQINSNCLTSTPSVSLFASTMLVRGRCNRFVKGSENME